MTSNISLRLWNKMAGWKSNMLNMAGRLVLGKAMLGSIPSHVMNYIKIPEGVAKAMDKVTRDFLGREKENASSQMGCGEST